jgi:hypothetical protein
VKKEGIGETSEEQRVAVLLGERGVHVFSQGVAEW